MTLELFSWLLAAMSLGGNFFVIKKNVVGLWIWTFSNLGWACFNLAIGVPAQAFLFTVYLAMSIWGIISWSKENKEELAKGPSA